MAERITEKSAIEKQIIKEMDKMNGNNHQDGNTVYSKTLHFANKN